MTLNTPLITNSIDHIYDEVDYGATARRNQHGIFNDKKTKIISEKNIDKKVKNNNSNDKSNINDNKRNKISRIRIFFISIKNKLSYKKNSVLSDKSKDHSSKLIEDKKHTKNEIEEPIYYTLEPETVHEYDTPEAYIPAKQKTNNLYTYVNIENLHSYQSSNNKKPKPTVPPKPIRSAKSLSYNKGIKS